MALVIFSVICCALLFAFPLLQISAYYSVNWIEGWNAYYGSIAADGGSLYANVLAAPNYPPFSFYIYGILGRLFGSPVIAGRILSVIALLGVSLAIFLIVRVFSQNSRLALLGALWALNLFLILAPDYVGMNSPQFLAHAVIMSAMFCFIQYQNSLRVSHLVLAAILSLVALFIKHNLVAFPIAVALDLFFYSRKRFALWCLAFFGVGGAMVIGVHYASEGRFIPALLLKRNYDLETLLRHIRFSAAVLWVPLMCSLPIALKLLKVPRWRWLSLYFFCSRVVGVLAYGGAGIDVNLFFDFVIAMGMILPLGLSISKFRPRKYLVPVMVGYFILGLALCAYRRGSLDTMRTKEVAYKKEVRYLGSVEGPAICEDLLLCFWAKKPLLFEPFIVSQQMRNHEIEAPSILAPLRNKTWAIVQLNEPEVPNRFTETFLETLHWSYGRDESIASAERAYYRPRP